MPTYFYQCDIHGEFEFQQKITEEPLQFCPQCQEENKPSSAPKRLIAPTNFVLVGGGWARDNYSKK